MGGQGGFGQGLFRRQQTGIVPVGWLEGRAYPIYYNQAVDDGNIDPHGTTVASVIIDHCPEALVYSYNVFGGNLSKENRKWPIHLLWRRS